MYAMDALRSAARAKGISLYALSKAIGKTPQYANSIVTRGSTPRADTLSRMLKACDYELCAVPQGEVTEHMFVID